MYINNIIFLFLFSSYTFILFYIAPLRRILLSATLSADPLQLSKLLLINPLVITYNTKKQIKQENNEEKNKKIKLNDNEEEDMEIVTLPTSLSEYSIKCNESDRLLYLCYLLNDLFSKKLQIIIFCSSIDTSERLFTFLKTYYSDDKENDILLYSTSIKPYERIKLLEKYNNKEIRCLICTDSMARGIDIPSIDVVINYTPPTLFKTYVHRSGRTARAGREGSVYTLIEGGQFKGFKKLRLRINADSKSLKRYEVDEEKLNELVYIYIDIYYIYYRRNIILIV